MKLSILSFVILSSLTAVALSAPSDGSGNGKSKSKSSGGSSTRSGSGSGTGASSKSKSGGSASKSSTTAKSGNAKSEGGVPKKRVDEDGEEASTASGATPTTASERVPEGKTPITKEKDEVTEGPVEKIPRLAAVTSIEPEELASFEHYAPQIQELIRKALGLTKMNLTYTFGSADPKQGGMDCSGTIYFLLKDFGFKGVPRQSDQMAGWVQDKTLLHRITDAETLSDPEFSALQPGDLLFWSGTYVTGPREIPVTHVMLYLGKLKKGNRHVVFGSSDGRAYQGERRTGVSVFDFSLPRSGSKATFYGFGMIPGVGTIRPPKPPAEPVVLAQVEPRAETRLQDIAKVPTTKVVDTSKSEPEKAGATAAAKAEIAKSEARTSTAVKELESKKTTVTAKSSSSERAGADRETSSGTKRSKPPTEKPGTEVRATEKMAAADEAPSTADEPKFEVRRAELPDKDVAAADEASSNEVAKTATPAEKASSSSTATKSASKSSSTKTNTVAKSSSSGSTKSASASSSNKSRTTVRRRPPPPPTTGEKIEKAAKRIASSFRDAFSP